MNLDKYQEKAMLYRMATAGHEYARLNLAGEVGELLSIFAKGCRDGLDFAYEERIKKELGDILWHIAAIAADYGFGLDEIAKLNLEKLKDRAARGTLGGSGDNR